MKHSILFLLAVLMMNLATAQPFAVGHLSLNVYDASRSGGSAISGAPSWGSTGRAIGTEIYYPATTAGNNTTAANGQFPVVVLGHGFVMTYDSYNTIYEELAKQGFIVALPTTEGGFSPVHADFGADMRFLAQELPNLNSNNIVALLQGHVLPKAAIGGHSMGAGCSMVGAQNNASIYALFNMATATSNTNGVSSLAGAPSIIAPTLILSGERDCVADTTVQIQHYTACGASLKYLAILNDVTHCDFGNGSSITCTFGQTSTGCPNTIPNTQANNAVLYYLLPFLQRTLKNDCAAADTFMNRITLPNTVALRTQHQGNLACFPNAVNQTKNEYVNVYPNPTKTNWTISNNNSSLTHYAVYDMLGRCCWEIKSTERRIEIPSNNWMRGMYCLRVHGGSVLQQYRLMKAE
jgi:dienelactone hydrolase